MASTTIKRRARHRIKVSHVGDKIHLVCLHDMDMHAHDELGGNVEDGEEYNREVVRYERDGRPVTLEEHVPGAKLE
jgi:hypothetical protein